MSAVVFIRLNLKYLYILYAADKRTRERKAMFILNIVPNYAHMYEHIEF